LDVGPLECRDLAPARSGEYERRDERYVLWVQLAPRSHIAIVLFR